MSLCEIYESSHWSRRSRLLYPSCPEPHGVYFEKMTPSLFNRLSGDLSSVPREYDRPLDVFLVRRSPPPTTFLRIPNLPRRRQRGEFDASLEQLFSISPGLLSLGSCSESFFRAASRAPALFSRLYGFNQRASSTRRGRPRLDVDSCAALLSEFLPPRTSRSLPLRLGRGNLRARIFIPFPSRLLR